MRKKTTAVALFSSVGSLVFANTKPEDSSIYMCMAYNDVLDKRIEASLRQLEVVGKRILLSCLLLLLSDLIKTIASSSDILLKVKLLTFN